MRCKEENISCGEGSNPQRCKKQGIKKMEGNSTQKLEEKNGGEKKINEENVNIYQLFFMPQPQNRKV